MNHSYMTYVSMVCGVFLTNPSTQTLCLCDIWIHFFSSNPLVQENGNVIYERSLKRPPSVSVHSPILNFGELCSVYSHYLHIITLYPAVHLFLVCYRMGGRHPFSAFFPLTHDRIYCHSMSSH